MQSELYRAPWLEQPLGPFRNKLYRARTIAVFTIVGIFGFFAFIGLASFFQTYGIVTAAFAALALLVWVGLRRPSISFSIPQSVSFGTDGINLRIDSPFGSVNRQVAYFDVVPQSLADDGSVTFSVRNTELANKGKTRAGQPFGKIRLEPTAARQVSQNVPGFLPHSLGPVALWAQKAGWGTRALIRDAGGTRRPALVIWRAERGLFSLQGEGEQVTVFARIAVSDPKVPNPFTPLSSEDRQRVGSHLRQYIGGLGSVTAHAEPDGPVDIGEIRFVELSKSVAVRRDNPTSFKELDEVIGTLTTETQKLVADVNAQLRGLRPGTPSPPSDLYG